MVRPAGEELTAILAEEDAAKDQMKMNSRAIPPTLSKTNLSGTVKINATLMSSHTTRSVKPNFSSRSTEVADSSEAIEKYRMPKTIKQAKMGNQKCVEDERSLWESSSLLDCG